MSYLIIRSITGPLKPTVEYVKLISAGNFKETLDIKSSDELGVMVNSMNVMSKNLRAIIQGIIKGIGQLNTSTVELTKISKRVSDAADDNAHKANTVTSASKEMSSNMYAAAKNMKTSAQNTNSIVVAIEEMTNTINEISKNTGVAKPITEKAVERSAVATEKMKKLNNVAGTISKVTESISDISEQTNLLSLNATIEAARAGDAGKGFAIVANEIKELAKQTEVFTKDIKGLIKKNISSTCESVEEIDQISVVITEIRHSVITIAAAIEEQSIATREIAQNVTIVSDGIVEVSQNVEHSSSVAGEITQLITDVYASTDDLKKNSRLSKNSVENLSQLATTLNKMMEQFVV